MWNEEMGWTKLGISARPAKVDYDVFLKHDPQRLAIQNDLQNDLEYPFCAHELDRLGLPFISPEVVKQHTGKARNRLCKFKELGMPSSSTNYCLQGIVIDDIVYDCSNFISEHPGGEAVIRNLGGSDCSCTLCRPVHGSSSVLTCRKGNSGDFIVQST